jgi:NAD-dependent DNA ligase
VRKRFVRSTSLIANFVNGYADGWAFAVGEAFRDQLDITLSERIVTHKKIKIWTQGEDFCFRKGETIYDTIMAYQEWAEAYKAIKQMIQIKDAAPAYRFFDSPGFVEFNLLKPISERLNDYDRTTHILAQKDFVLFLKTGEMVATIDVSNIRNQPRLPLPGDIFDEESDIIFNGKTFCFTGNSPHGDRDFLEKLVNDLGGSITGTMNNSVDYVVVGSNKNPDWAYENYGRKILKAIEINQTRYRPFQQKIIIIHDDRFIRAANEKLILS